MTCDNCGKENLEGAKYCNECGNMLAAQNEGNDLDNPQNDKINIQQVEELNPQISTDQLKAEESKDSNKKSLKDIIMQNKKTSFPIIAILVALLFTFIGYNIYNAPVKEAMGYIDDMAEWQTKIEYATDNKSLELRKRGFELSKRLLEMTEKKLSEAQLEKVEAYKQSKNLNKSSYTPDTALKIENVKLYTSGDYTYYEGTLVNKGDKSYSFVEVRATYLDANKQVLTTDWTYAVGGEGIRPNERAQFKLMTEVRGQVKHGRLEIVEWQ